ncbi:MAG: hypothetical protein DMG60_15240 [Acidobacteria bacterium]|nr:MAG: hypothetical protein DMG60_15240 [Acidobacteriota bacterium]
MAGMMVSRSLVVDGGRRLLKARRHIMVLYIANLLLGWFATFGLSSRIGPVTGLSLNSERLVRGFDLGTFLELVNKPEVALYSQVPLGLAFSGMFVIFQLFLTGGIITQYLAAEHIDRSRFYAACGESFWRMVRVALIFVVITALVAGAFYAFRAALDVAVERSGHARTAFSLKSAVLLIEALALLWIRMWFDVAQTDIVASDARRVRSGVAYSFKSVRSAVGLYASYVLIGILMLLGTAFAVFLWWTAAPPSHVIISFLILQSILAFLIALRWWQRAVAADWYPRNLPVRAAIQSAFLKPLPPESAVPEVPLSQ